VRNRISVGTPALGIAGPLLGQVELKGNWQAGVLVGQGQTDRHLTIFFLAQRRAVLPGDADRVPAGLGDAGIVEDPGLDRTALLERRHSAPADDVKHRLIVPRRFGNEVVQRLVGCLDMPRIEPGGSMLLRPPGSSRPVQ
jgi:hypothetical protein